MKINEFNWIAANKDSIYAKEWVAANANAVVCMVHGLGEHINRYEHFAEYLQQYNIAMIGNDHHGHGKSGGKRGHAPNYEAFMDEIDVLIDEAKQRYPNLPIFLYGHSMGGNFVMNYALKRAPKIAGIISSGPAITIPKPSQPSAALLLFAKIMNNIFPSLQQPNGLDPNHVSKDETVVKKYIDDPLVHNQISIRTALNIINYGENLNKNTKALPIPLLLMHAEEDHLTDPQGSIDFAKRVGGDLTFKLWSGMYHEIHNEPGHQEVFKFVLDWMKTKM